MNRKIIGKIIIGLLVVGIIAMSGCVEKDSDGDGWSNGQEKSAGTDPYKVDTDGDGIWDPHDPNPLIASSTTPTPTPVPTAFPTPAPNSPPNIPSRPSGSSSGSAGTSYTYSTSATDPNGDKVQYRFDWDDGTVSSWTSLVNSGASASESHYWSRAGIYYVRARVRDMQGATSSWSSTKTVTISTPSTPTPTATPTKGEALDFSLELVETYFTGDENKFCSHLADTLYTLEGEGPITKEEAISSIKGRNFPFGEDYSKYTIDDYLENYRPKIMDYEDYSKEYPELSSLSIDGWKPDDDDLLFLGYEVKPGKEGFMWDDLLLFMVTYQNGKWELIAFSG